MVALWVWRNNRVLQLLGPHIPATPVTRFAPSPTGHLHLGHVANAVWVWGIARALGGVVVLRMEDHDRGRCRPEYERSILDDLRWLGLRADIGEDELRGGGVCAYRQSDCAEVYAQAIDALGDAVYVCQCSRKSIMARGGGRAAGEELRYDGFCRNAEQVPAMSLGLRLALPDEAVSFDDIALGRQVQHPARACGDVLLRERNGHFTYQLCVVVDDRRHGVNLVVRGTDLLVSTGRQLLIARRLGPELPPAYLHHPLIADASGRKLSKRDFSKAIREHRAEGRSAASLLGEAAWRTGLLEAPRDIAADALGELFSQ